ncbi:MAG: hypothetical protein ACI35P_00345 [Bacillus sp. (in: firmicutes)]
MKSIIISLAVVVLLSFGSEMNVFAEKNDETTYKDSMPNDFFQDRQIIRIAAEPSYPSKKSNEKPPIVDVQGEFLDHYRAKIQVLNKVHIIDLSAYSPKYEQEKVYQNGIVDKALPLLITEYVQLMPYITTNRKGIRGVQRVMGPLNDVSIGELITIWYKDNGEWQLRDIELKSKIKKTYHYYDYEITS